jgi:hypothetical protein
LAWKPATARGTGRANCKCWTIREKPGKCQSTSKCEDLIEAPSSVFHQGQRLGASIKVRIDGGNLCPLTAIDWGLGKPGASIYGVRRSAIEQHRQSETAKRLMKIEDVFLIMVSHCWQVWATRKCFSMDRSLRYGSG